MAKKNKNKNPNKSWRKFEKETWLQYLDRLLTYNRLQVIFGGLTLLFTILSFCYLILPPTENERLKKTINDNVAIIEGRINRESIMTDNDSTEYNKLINNFKIDILDYVGLWKAVSNSELSEDYADLEMKEAQKILENEYERRIQLGEFAQKLFKGIKAIRSYEYLTDTLYVTKISEEKQTRIIKLLKEQNSIDSVYAKKIIGYLKQVNSDYSNNLNYKKDLRKAIYEMIEMTQNNHWYKYHNSIMEFLIETNNLFDISKRKYSNIEPYKYLDEAVTSKVSQADTIGKENVRQLLLKILDKDNM